MASPGSKRVARELQNRHIVCGAALGGIVLLVAVKGLGADYELHASDGVVLALVGLMAWVVRRGELRLSVEQDELERRFARRTAELGDAQQTYQALFDFCPIALQIFDVDSLRYVAANDAAVKLTGYARDELIGRSVLDTAVALAPDTPDAIRGFQGEWSGAAKFRRADETVRDVEVYTRPLTFQGKACWMVASLDTTTRHALERQLSQAQRMDAVGRLACGVAHEFNDMLSVLLGYAALLLEDCSPSDPMFVPLREMQRAGERASDVSRRLLTFSRLQPSASRAVDLNDAVRSAKTALADAVAPCSLALSLTSQECVTHADPAQLEQIMVNLVSNARDAMSEGGTITIETAVTYEPIVAVGQSERRVILSVRDSGPGIPAEIRSRVFEPFFTTKPQGRGTGLGLSIVYGIVEQCGGVISLATPPDGGTEVAISLASIDAGEPSHDTRPSTPASGSTSVLLVASDSAVSVATQSALTRMGYRVLVARDAGQAAILLEEHIHDIDVLLTESMLGSVSGTELARRLELASPRLKTLYLPEDTDGGVVSSSDCTITTAISPRALSKRLRAMLENTGAMEHHASQ